jgi:hypothetical protein
LEESCWTSASACYCAEGEMTATASPFPLRDTLLERSGNFVLSYQKDLDILGGARRGLKRDRMMSTITTVMSNCLYDV